MKTLSRRNNFENALVWTARTEVFKDTDMATVICACLRMLYQAFLKAFLGQRQRFSVDGEHFVHFGGENYTGSVWIGPQYFSPKGRSTLWFQIPVKASAMMIFMFHFHCFSL